jgi:hypothetical protein
VYGSVLSLVGVFSLGFPLLSGITGVSARGCLLASGR